jgi:hypothetical protein
VVDRIVGGRSGRRLVWEHHNLTAANSVF